MLIDLFDMSALHIVRKSLGDVKVGLTSGCFDLLHPLHLAYLERCRRHCDVLAVGVDSDALVMALKKRPATLSEYHRAQMVNALKCVDFVFIMNSVEQFGEASDFFTADYLFKHTEQMYGQPIVGHKQGVNQVIIVPDIALPDSSTAIKERIRSETVREPKS